MIAEFQRVLRKYEIMRGSIKERREELPQFVLISPSRL